MAPERIDNIMRGRDALTQEEIDLGYHCCPGWDFLLIQPGDPEWEACCCDLVHDWVAEKS